MEPTLCKIEFVNEPWDDVAIFQMEIVVLPVDVRRNYGREIATVLAVVGSVTGRTHVYTKGQLTRGEEQ